MKSKISSIDYYLPHEVVKTRHMMEEAKPSCLDIDNDLIKKLIGIEEVRHAPRGMLPSELAIKAANKMLEKSNINRNKIDAVIFCGIERDCAEPSTAHYVQHALGIHKAECKDVSNACLGFMTGLKDADMMIQCGDAKNVLVCTGERPSKVSYQMIEQLRVANNIKQFRRKLGGLTVGDAGAAALVSISEDKSGFRGMNFVSYGHLADLCYYKHLKSGKIEGQMLMREISSEILNAHEKLYPETQKKLKIKSNDIDCLITHQVGKKPFMRYPKILGVKQDLMTKTFDKLGNITSATFAVNYAKALQSKRIKRGDFVLAAMAGSGLTVCQVGITV